MQAIIRRARPEDAEEIARFGLASWHVGIAPHVGEIARSRDIYRLFLYFVRDRYDEILVAEHNGRPVAFAATEHGDNFISDLWVAPDHFGRGIGQALIGALEKIIIGRGYATAAISALSANTKALRLYRYCGYRETATQEAFDDALGELVEKKRLEKTLP